MHGKSSVNETEIAIIETMACTFKTAAKYGRKLREAFKVLLSTKGSGREVGTLQATICMENELNIFNKKILIINETDFEDNSAASESQKGVQINGCESKCTVCRSIKREFIKL